MELTNEDSMGLDAQTSKDEDRLEEGVTEEPKRFTTRGVSLLEEALLVFEAQEPNVEQYTKAVAAVQNAVQCYCVIYDQRKGVTSLIAVGKESACNVGDPGSIPGSGRFPGEGNGNLFQYSCLEDPMDRGAQQATVSGVARFGHD